MEVLNLIRLFWGWGFPYISLTYSLYRTSILGTWKVWWTSGFCHHSHHSKTITSDLSSLGFLTRLVTFNPYLPTYLAHRRPPPFRWPEEDVTQHRQSPGTRAGPGSGGHCEFELWRNTTLWLTNSLLGDVLERHDAHTHTPCFLVCIHCMCGISQLYHSTMDSWIILESGSKDEVCCKGVLWLTCAYCIHSGHRIICCADPGGKTSRHWVGTYPLVN